MQLQETSAQVTLTTSQGSKGQGKGYGDIAAAAKLLQSCPTLCDPIDGSPSVHIYTGYKNISFVCYVTKKSKPGASDPHLFIPQIFTEHPLYARYCPRLQRYRQWPRGTYIPLVETENTKVIRNCKHSRWK